MNNSLYGQAQELIAKIKDTELEQMAYERTKQMLEKDVGDYQAKLQKALEDYEISSNAVKLLQKVSATSVKESYKFIEDNINEALKRIFPDKIRMIKLEETLRGNYPQLELSLIVESGVKRSLSDGSGHGIAQVVSALCTLCLIVIRGGRRLVVFDEVTSGMDRETRKMFEQVMWEFTTIGFQFISVEHGFKPPHGAYVVHLCDGADIGKTHNVAYVDKTYIEGVTGNTVGADEI